MNKIICLVGLPGCGKTTYCNNYVVPDNTVVKWFSSDNYREKLWGNAADQQQPAVVFNTLHNDLEQFLLEPSDLDKVALYDATNITRKSRRAMFRRFAGIPNLTFECVLFCIPIDICKQRNKERETPVPDAVIDNMVKRFDTPCLWEGFAKIELIQSDNPYSIDELFSAAMIPHDNPHHEKDNITDHITRAVFEAGVDDAPIIIIEAMMLHDIGKPFVKTFSTAEDGTKIAHYYGHEHMGAYLTLCLSNKMIMSDLLTLSQLVNYHMVNYYPEEAKEKFFEQVNDTDFINNILMIGKYDEAAK